jgi:hypothetical protein
VLDRLPIPRFNSKNKLHVRISDAAHECSQSAKRGDSQLKAEEKLNEAIAELLDIKPQSLKAIQRALAELVSPGKQIRPRTLQKLSSPTGAV